MSECSWTITQSDTHVIWGSISLIRINGIENEKDEMKRSDPGIVYQWEILNAQLPIRK